MSAIPPVWDSLRHGGPLLVGLVAFLLASAGTGWLGAAFVQPRPPAGATPAR